MTISPAIYNLPHDDFRPKQLEAIQQIEKANNRITILEAPVGSGKSAIATALSVNDKTVSVLTVSKALQHQYVDEYGYETISGMANYDCVLLPPLKADSCLFIDNMQKCSMYNECAYVKARKKYQEAQLKSTNYHYSLAAQWTRTEEQNTLILDEAHLIPELLLEIITTEFSRSGFSSFGVNVDFVFTSIPDKIKLVRLIDSLKTVRQKIQIRIDKLLKLSSNGLSENQKNTLKTLIVNEKNFTKILLYLLIDIDNFTIRITDNSNFSVIPYLPVGFRENFINSYSYRMVAMSATIGNIESFTKVLGIDSYKFLQIESNFSPKERPIYVYKNAPKMSYRAKPSDYENQADIIAQICKDYPDWAGIIHVNSQAKQQELAKRLSKRDLSKRIYLPYGQSTEDKLNNFLLQIKRRKNVIGISYSFNEGVNLGDCNINISADIPFRYIDDIERERINRNKEFYYWVAANKIEQRCGRTRRGRQQDYDTDTERRGYVAIVDASYNIVKSRLSNGFLDSVVITE
jgi:ATP-dependent DNA helicase DinG